MFSFLKITIYLTKRLIVVHVTEKEMNHSHIFLMSSISVSGFKFPCCQVDTRLAFNHHRCGVEKRTKNKTKRFRKTNSHLKPSTANITTLPVTISHFGRHPQNPLYCPPNANLSFSTAVAKQQARITNVPGMQRMGWIEAILMNKSTLQQCCISLMLSTSSNQRGKKKNCRGISTKSRARPRNHNKFEARIQYPHFFPLCKKTSVRNNPTLPQKKNVTELTF